MRIGIFGGTFDPVHNGHLICAKEVMEKLKLHKILFIPTGEPPHKIARQVTPGQDRLAMLAAAVSYEPRFEISDIECRRPDYTYTYDTLTELRRSAAPDDEFYMIIGADTLADIFNWYRSGEVFKLCSFIAMKRPGYPEDLFAENLKKAEAAGAAIFTAAVSQVDVSSTQIRKLAALGDSIDSFVPKAVAQYIQENHIYRQRNMSFTDIIEDLSKLLSEKRFTHCIGVMNESVRIGRIYGADPEKCRIAGLLHDCARELTPQQYRWLGLKIEEKDDYNGKEVLLHGEAGAILAEARYGITDQDVLEAIRCHVTGCPEMGLTAQIVFVADYTEPGRRGVFFDDIRRKISEGSIDEAILMECENTIRYILDKGKSTLCTETVRTRNWVWDKIKKETAENGHE